MCKYTCKINILNNNKNNLRNVIHAAVCKIESQMNVKIDLQIQKYETKQILPKADM